MKLHWCWSGGRSAIVLLLHQVWEEPRRRPTCSLAKWRTWLLFHLWPSFWEWWNLKRWSSSLSCSSAYPMLMKFNNRASNYEAWCLQWKSAFFGLYYILMDQGNNTKCVYSYDDDKTWRSILDHFPQVSNIIFLDQPVGTGFSYSRTSLHNKPSDSGEAKRIHEFLQNVNYWQTLMSLGATVFGA